MGDKKKENRKKKRKSWENTNIYKRMKKRKMNEIWKTQRRKEQKRKERKTEKVGESDHREREKEM